MSVCGLCRMGWSERISEHLEPAVCMHAVGQGALAVECREEDRETLAILAPLHHRYQQERSRVGGEGGAVLAGSPFVLVFKMALQSSVADPDLSRSELITRVRIRPLVLTENCHIYRYCNIFTR